VVGLSATAVTSGIGLSIGPRAELGVAWARGASRALGVSGGSGAGPLVMLGGAALLRMPVTSALHGFMEIEGGSALGFTLAQSGKEIGAFRGGYLGLALGAEWAL
jgi:hypothetical protein